MSFINDFRFPNFLSNWASILFVKICFSALILWLRYNLKCAYVGWHFRPLFWDKKYSPRSILKLLTWVSISGIPNVTYFKLITLYLNKMNAVRFGKNVEHSDGLKFLFYNQMPLQASWVGLSSLLRKKPLRGLNQVLPCAAVWSHNVHPTYYAPSKSIIELCIVYTAYTSHTICYPRA